MMVIGRGHTVYFDNKSLDYEGETYESPYKIEIYHGRQCRRRIGREALRRASAVSATQHRPEASTVTLVITQEKGGDEAEPAVYTIDLPYNMDGPVINLPAYLAGLPGGGLSV